MAPLALAVSISLLWWACQGCARASALFGRAGSGAAATVTGKNSSALQNGVAVASKAISQPLIPSHPPLHTTQPSPTAHVTLTSHVATKATKQPSPTGHVTLTSHAATKAKGSHTASSLAPAVTLDPDLTTIASRRAGFAVLQQSGATSIPQWLASLGPDGKWPDTEVDYTTGCPARRANWPAQEHWIRLGAMAAAWHGGFPGADPSYVQNPNLLAQLSLGMDWWFSRDFTVDACLDQGGSSACPCSTPGMWNTNWFSNVILIPRLVGQTCVLLTGSLTTSQLGNCTHMTGRTYSTFQRSVTPGWLVGSNVLDIASISIVFGLLTGDANVVTDAYNRVHGEVAVKSGFQANGILTDGSFAQHAGLLYNGNYGKDYSNDVLELEIEAGGTRFAASGGPVAAFETLMSGSQWMIYLNTLTSVLHWDFSTEGRFISFPVADQQATGSININLTEVLQLSQLWNDAVLGNVYNGLTAQSSTANVGSLVGNRMFWNNDYMVTRGTNYVSTLKMFSSRTRNSECVNSQNLLGFHLADGATYTYITGDEYEDISAAWDWNLIPGITVDYGGTPLSCNTVNQVGIQSFVGGVSTGNIGAAAMRYTNPLTQTLSFQKAWFYFPGDIQHVIVSILAPTGSTSVFSVLDQSKHNGNIYINNAPVSSGNFSSPVSLYHASTGYHFWHVSTVSVSAGPSTGSWASIGTSLQPPTTVDLFAAWIVHDPAPNALAAEYSIFPGRTRDAFETEAGARPLRTLQADTHISAIQDTIRTTTFSVFWDSTGGTIAVPVASPSSTTVSVTANGGCIIILNHQSWTVTVADPTQLLANVQLTFQVNGALPQGWVGASTKTLTISLPAPPFAGSSVSQPLQ